MSNIQQPMSNHQCSREQPGGASRERRLTAWGDEKERARRPARWERVGAVLFRGGGGGFFRRRRFFSGKPLGLAGALEKLQRASQAIPMDANPSTAHMFIVNPLTGRSLMALFSTHPPIEERIARLRSMRPA